MAKIKLIFPIQIHPIYDLTFSLKIFYSESNINPKIKNNAIALLTSHENYLINSFLSSKGLKIYKNKIYKTDKSVKFIH